MTNRASRSPNSWVRLLVLFTAAGFIETVFFGQLNAFMPLHLPRLGITPTQVSAWTGAIVAISSAIGIPFLPFWGALADRYARQPIIVRSFVVHLIAALMMLLAGNVWVFVIGRAFTSLALGNSGLMLLVDAALMLLVVLALSFGYKDSYRGTGRGPLLSMAVESVRLILGSARLRSLFVALFLLFAGWMLA